MNESIHTLVSSNIKDIEDMEEIEELSEHDILEFEAGLI